MIPAEEAKSAQTTKPAKKAQRGKGEGRCCEKEHAGEAWFRHPGIPVPPEFPVNIGDDFAAWATDDVITVVFPGLSAAKCEIPKHAIWGKVKPTLAATVPHRAGKARPEKPRRQEQGGGL